MYMDHYSYIRSGVSIRAGLVVFELLPALSLHFKHVDLMFFFKKSSVDFQLILALSMLFGVECKCVVRFLFFDAVFFAS